MSKILQVAFVALPLLFLGCDSKPSLEERKEIIRELEIKMDRSMSDDQKIKFLKPYCDKGIGEICFMMMLIEIGKNGDNNIDKQKYIKRLNQAYENSIDERTKRVIKDTIYHLEKELGR
ncbi:MAG: hypothetical protein ACTTJC_08070 [Campylobacter sp.]